MDNHSSFGLQNTIPENANHIFENLNALNVNKYTEEKNGLTYLSWAWAWSETKKKYPTANYRVKKFENNLPYVYDKNTGYMVFVEVTIEGLTHEMWLPVMDNSNKAMKSEAYEYKIKGYTKICEAATMFDINKTIMRALVKCLGMFGLGLYIYSGEDLPETEEQKTENKPKPENKPATDKNRTPLQTEIADLSKEAAKIIGSTVKEAYTSALTNLKLKGETEEEQTKIRDYLKGIIENAKAENV